APRERCKRGGEVAAVPAPFHPALKTSSDVLPICPNKRRRRLQQALVILAAVAAGALATAVGLRLWSGRGGAGTQETSTPPLAVLHGNAGTVWGVAFSPDDRTLAMAVEEGPGKLWDLGTKTVRATLTGHRAAVWSAAFNRDGTLLATSSDDNTARIWDLKANKTIQTLKTAAAARAALFTRDGTTVYTGDRGGNIRAWGLPG